jgi:hypothetical protein
MTVKSYVALKNRIFVEKWNKNIQKLELINVVYEQLIPLLILA